MIAQRLYGTRGWTILGVFSAVVFIVLPTLNLLVGPESAFHVSTTWVTLFGKIMCYAIVAVAMDLIWGYAGILSLGHGLFFALGGYSCSSTGRSFPGSGGTPIRSGGARSWW